MAIVKPLSDHELLVFFIQFAVLLAVARALGELAVRLRLPSVVGELLAGFVLGPTLFGNVAPGLFHALFPAAPEQSHLLELVSWIGVMMLLILTGLETDIGLIVRKAKGAAAISLGGILVPFTMGIALGFLLPSTFVAASNKRLVFALFIGTAMSISAIPVIAKVLMDMKIIRRDIGQITLAAGMIDDTVGWILLSVVAGLATSGSINFGTIGRSIVSVLVVLVAAYTVGRKLVALIIRTVDNVIGGDMVKITALMVIALTFGSITQALRLEAVLGAFLAGILVGQVKRFDDRLRHIFEQVALGIFAPVFFARSGLQVELSRLFTPSVLLVGVVALVVATVGKFIGAYAGARISKLNHWESLSLGAGMNARGAMEIIVATIGLSEGILTPDMYSIILMIAIATSLMAPPLLRWTLARVEVGTEERDRLEAEDRQKESFVGNLKRVLIPSGDAPAVEPAAQIVKLIVGDDDVEVTNLTLRQPGGDDATDDAEAAEVKQQLGTVRRLVREANGNRASVILAEAQRGYDLLVMPSRGQLAPGDRPEFAVEVSEVIQQAPCPLLVVSIRDTPAQPDGAPGGDGAGGGEGATGRPPDRIRTILVPVAGTPNDRRAAEVGFSMARNGGVVELIHVVSASQHALRVRSDEALQEAVELGEDLVRGLAELGRAMGARVTTDVVVSDHAEQAIIERAIDPTDLIVVASDRRPVTQRAFFGHRVDHILANAPCTVVVVSAS
ncbi:MAG: cation:proton antiporter [Acidimicrobiales bacterium]